ncbi:MAG: S8 family serine peptidase, partial [Pseudomonadota bacterium]
KSLKQAIMRRVDEMYAEANGEREQMEQLSDPKQDRSRELATAAALLTFLGAIRIFHQPSQHERQIDIRNLREMSQQANFKSSRIADAGNEIFKELKAYCESDPDSICNRQPLVFAISLNRPVELAVNSSANTIKADSARLLFSTDCSGLAWAILDSGIETNHPGFIDHRRGKGSRVKASFDFTRMRALVSPEYQFNATRLNDAAQFFFDQFDDDGPKLNDIKEELRQFSKACADGRPLDWTALRPYIEIDKPETKIPANAHGTHVAGILGADWRKDDDGDDDLKGICPDIKLYDFRVVGVGIKDTEFNVIAAMQFIRWLNERNNYRIIHGANLSLSIPHSVRNYACGATPVCEEADRLVRSGVFVTAAAGNRGYQNYQLLGGDVFESYAPSSITDPGNAESVLTVGSTHRGSPHTYGVSFFSSRGPTGDGRSKPDLLAPGEKIVSLVPEGAEDTRDGTSMAAPHAAGAAALLMARNSEFEG